MVYVNNGVVVEGPPWSISRVFKLLNGVVTFIILFFKTMIGFDTSSSNKGSSRGSGEIRGTGSGWGGGGGGGGGGPFRPSGGGGSGPRFRSMRDINQPTIGGCPGGSCGM